MSALVEAVLAVVILANTIALGLSIDAARRLGKQSTLARRAWHAARARCPQTANVLLQFVDVWDQFTKASEDVSLEARFSIFCDQLGDLLEAMVQQAVAVLERFFALAPHELAAQLRHLPKRRLSAADVTKGVGGLAATSCSICLCDYRRAEEVRVLPACQHVFHSRCVDGWLCRQDACPLCRMPVLAGLATS